MYYPKKTLAVISLISVGAIALGGVTTAFAHTGGFENTPPAKAMTEQHVSDNRLNSADTKVVSSEHLSGRADSSERWRTATGRATARRLGGNDNKVSTRDEAEGTMGGEDYDVSSDQPESGSSSNDYAEPDDSTSAQRNEAATGQPERAVGHSDPSSHIHAGAHESDAAEGPRGADDYDGAAGLTDTGSPSNDSTQSRGMGVAPRGTESKKSRLYRNEGHESPQSHIHAGPEKSGVTEGSRGADKYDPAAGRPDAASPSNDSTETNGKEVAPRGTETIKPRLQQDEGHESPQSHIHAGPQKSG